MIRKFRLSAIAIGIACVAVTGVAGTVAATANPADPVNPADRERPDRSATSQRIASTTLDKDLQVTLEVTRATRDEVTATTYLVLARFTNGHWREEQRIQVGAEEGWFWFPLTASRAVCQFSAGSTTGSDDPVQERFVVNLIVTPSIGCSGDLHYIVRDGQLTGLQ